ncbi:MAG: TonB family protein [Bacteroidota bacterium]
MWKEIPSTGYVGFYRIDEEKGGNKILATYFYKTGELYSKQERIDDTLKSGHCVWYYLNGQKLTEADYLNGKLIRNYVNYERNGKIKYEAYYGDTVETDQIVSFPHVEAEFIGGNEEMNAFIINNLRYPLGLFRKEGKVYVRFIVEKDGSVTNVRVVNRCNKQLAEEAIRVISSMPKWKPAESFGVKVRQDFGIPINFTLR